jgi:antitoxin HicB
MNKHIGSRLDDLLEEDAMLEQTTAVALKRVVAWQIAQAMKMNNLTETALADRMHATTASIKRLLDDADTSLTLTTLVGAANVLGKKVRIELN